MFTKLSDEKGIIFKWHQKVLFFFNKNYLLFCFSSITVSFSVSCKFEDDATNGMVYKDDGVVEVGNGNSELLLVFT